MRWDARTKTDTESSGSGHGTVRPGGIVLARGLPAKIWMTSASPSRADRTYSSAAAGTSAYADPVDQLTGVLFSQLGYTVPRAAHLMNDFLVALHQVVDD